ncbi:hypothetical protein psal_cds_375 [Pandoravirus salinus]|uniref:Uncharacterized protein n=1 Tax=Pandoravirus salinus TaxID=1349410 RepID=S4W1P6_9VIRU|nr:hypothetical protein psal_cds_375 [Pandoravirus salinus]AGO84050.2 hypothetical protein psal_cds_375 [Pandoravirus salinus]
MVSSLRPLWPRPRATPINRATRLHEQVPLFFYPRVADLCTVPTGRAPRKNLSKKTSATLWRRPLSFPAFTFYRRPLATRKNKDGPHGRLDACKHKRRWPRQRLTRQGSRPRTPPLRCATPWTVWAAVEAVRVGGAVVLAF